MSIAYRLLGISSRRKLIDDVRVVVGEATGNDFCLMAEAREGATIVE